MRGLGLNFAVMREVLEGERDGRLDQLVRPVLVRLSEGTQMATLGAFNEKFDPTWTSRYVVLDSAEYAATQAVVLAGAEGVTEVPVIGRFLRGVGAAS
jgi:lysyl-tRNA synthetase class 2